MIIASLLRGTSVVGNLPSFNSLDKEFLKLSGFKSLLVNGKILEENKLICSKNTILNLKDGDLHSKSMPYLPE